MKIAILNSHIRGSVSNEETFWSVLAEQLPGSKALALADFKGDIEEYLNSSNPDILIANSLLGNLPAPEKTKKIVLLQDDFVAMERLVPKTPRQKISELVKGNFAEKMIRRQRAAMERADVIVAVSGGVAKSYGIDATIIPIGTDANLFHPILNKQELRGKYGIPDGRVCIFVGSTHGVKGYDLLKKEMEQNPGAHYIVVLKDDSPPKIRPANTTYFIKVAQASLAELYNCADEYVGMSRVETLWLAPIEAMFCGIPVRVTSVGIFSDWKPTNKDPRAEAIAKGLDRDTMIKRWIKLTQSLAAK